MTGGKKVITIRAEYYSSIELQGILDRVYGRVRVGQLEHKEKQFEFQARIDIEPNTWRQEYIKGQLCWIIPSSMNSNPEKSNK
jgi:hypothetical protein